MLKRLADQGIRLSLDDFGTGYSSMSYLKRLPVDELKVDRSFVTDMSTSSGDALLVRSVIELGHNLGLHIVAEGVEDADTLDAWVIWAATSPRVITWPAPCPLVNSTSGWIRSSSRRLSPCPGHSSTPPNAWC